MSLPIQNQAFEYLEGECPAHALVSVIVPIYNAERYLEDGLRSVLTQSYHNLDIIAVDDCSKDNSYGILNSYAEKDSRIRTLRLAKNLGPGPARNAGLDLAEGDYIVFLDPDDMLTPDAIAKLVSTAEQHGSDLVKGTTRKMSPSGKRKGNYSKFVPSKKIVNTTLTACPELWLATEFWTYLYKKELLTNLRFLPLRLGEDFLFILQSLSRAKKMTLVPDCVHYYRENPMSLTHAKASFENCRDSIVGYNELFRFLRKEGLDDIINIRVPYQTELLMSTFVTAAHSFPFEVCKELFSLFKDGVEENSLTIVLPKQPPALQHGYWLLQMGFFVDAYSLFRRYKGKYNRRSLTRVYFSLTVESYLSRQQRKVKSLCRIGDTNADQD